MDKNKAANEWSSNKWDEQINKATNEMDNPDPDIPDEFNKAQWLEVSRPGFLAGSIWAQDRILASLKSLEESKVNLLLEKLAAIEHRQWVQWATKLLQEEPYLSRTRRERWEGLLGDYEDLPEEWKEYDREWARHVLRDVRIALGEILEEE